MEGAPVATHSGTRLGALFFLAQAALFVAWWAGLAAAPQWRSWFHPPGTEWEDLLAFALPDLALVVPLSGLAGIALLRGGRWALPLAWAATGAVAYSTGYLLAWAWLRDGAWLGVAAMVPAAALSTFFAVDVSAGRVPVFRRARPRSAAGNLATTFLYIALFWATFLVAIPASIAFVEARLGVPLLAFPFQRPAAVVLFAVASALALWSGVTMARRGDGTPLPMDSTNRLVTSGPYAYVRNPMMVTGLAQALAVAFWLGSWGTVVYLVGGGLLWNYLVRPAEERDLRELFGAEYEDYCRWVKCWVPSRSA